MDWSSYNQGLKNRYNLNLYISDDIVENWMHKERPKIWGQSPQYTDFAIKTCLQMRYLLGLPLRGTQGFMESIFKQQNIDLKVPHYTVLSRRQKDLVIDLKRKIPEGKFDIVVDSSGLKVYGEGEWKVRKHGYSKRRTWRKIHLASDSQTMQITACELTKNDVHDGTILPNLLEDNVKDVYADGAYDWKELHKDVENNGGKLIAPPRKDAVISVPENEAGILTTRDKYVVDIEEKTLAEWKKEIGYHVRSLSETQFFRWKTIFSHRLQSLHPYN